MVAGLIFPYAVAGVAVVCCCQRNALLLSCAVAAVIQDRG